MNLLQDAIAAADAPATDFAMPKDLLAIADLDPAALRGLITLALAWKRDPAAHAAALAGKSIVLLFEKPSLRTRVSLEIGLHRLGAQALYFDHQGSRLGERESIPDNARTLERYAQAIVLRTFAHATVEALAAAASVPVVNALSDAHHPCQALADVLTMIEHGVDPSRDTVAWLGDGNNVCHSLVEAIALLGGRVEVIVPKGCLPDPGVIDRAHAIAKSTGATISVGHDPDAARGAKVLYTDTWTSMGESRDDAKLAALEPFRIDAARMRAAATDAIFMHCLPAHRGEEVAADVIDGPASVVFDQAENRLHAQNAWFIAALG